MVECGGGAELATGFEQRYSGGGGTAHEAGYDAYMTGVVFLKAAHLIGSQANQ
jgi:hypothetical protein